MGTPDTAAIVRYTIDLVIKIDQQNKKSDADFKKTKADLEKAITSGTIPMLKLLRPKLQQEVDDMDDCMSKIADAKARMENIQDDEAFANSHFEQVKTLLEKITDFEKAVTDRLKTARDLDKHALAAWDSAEGSETEAEHELAVLKDSVADMKKAVDKNNAEVPKQKDAAIRARDTRNQNALTAARVKLIDFKKAGLQAPILRDKVSKFMKKYHFHELNTEAQYLLDDLQRIEDSMKDLDKIIQELMAFGQVAQVDVGKAAKVLAIASKDQPKLAKVLNGQPATYLRGLDALADDLELDTTGKEMLSKLQKAQVV